MRAADDRHPSICLCNTTQSRFHSRYSSRCPADDGRHSQNRKRLGPSTSSIFREISQSRLPAFRSRAGRVAECRGMGEGHTRLQFEIRALARRAADELDEPPRTPHARHGQRRRRQGGDPAPRRGCRLSEIGRLSLATPTCSATPRLLEPLAASWSGRRDAVIGRRATSATTAPNPT